MLTVVKSLSNQQPSVDEDVKKSVSDARGGDQESKAHCLQFLQSTDCQLSSQATRDVWQDIRQNPDDERMLNLL